MRIKARSDRKTNQIHTHFLNLQNNKKNVFKKIKIGRISLFLKIQFYILF